MNAAILDLSTSFRPVAHTAAQVVALGAEHPRTGGDLLRDVRAVAAQLPPAGPGSEVLVVCGDRYHVAVAVLAAWERGHAVALPPNGAPETVRALRRRPGVVALLHDTDAAAPTAATAAAPSAALPSSTTTTSGKKPRTRSTTARTVAGLS